MQLDLYVINLASSCLSNFPFAIPVACCVEALTICSQGCANVPTQLCVNNNTQ